MREIEAFKLIDIARKELLHYQTVLQNKNKYIKVKIKRGGKTPLIRYLDKETTLKLINFL